ncbi:hypothetical protein BCR39DRAFT_461593 [Naematelia encephala]|uniref:Uncharacterized protein n=1 Tax=Naematelia encephala TaxID=71784 RepID=A0A1Y2BL39_9TREE|nr:hypothetical protein BCR39DRAFT_461593 [Naematelia encephala]
MSKTLSPLASPQALLARLTKLTSTIPGLDASLMLAQYSSPIVIALLLRLAKFRANHPRLSLQMSRAGAVGVKVDGGFGLVKLAEGWARAAGSIGDARVIMRAFGLLPILQWLLALHPKPLSSLRRLLTLSMPASALHSPKTLPTLQILTLLCYYPLEHLSWLASKGVVPLTPQGAGLASLWSVRFWAAYVVLEIYKLRQNYLSLQKRTIEARSARPVVTTSEAEGYELQDKPANDSSAVSVPPSVEAVSTLRKEWEAWKTAVLVNG